MVKRARHKAKFNNSFFRTFKGGSDIDRVWDCELPGFGLRVRRRPEPSKWTWVYVYRHKATKKQIVITLGSFLQKTPEEARRAAKEAAGRANTSDDVWDERVDTLEQMAEERRAPDVATLWDEYWEAEGRHKKWHIRLTQIWRKHLKPFFGKMKVRDVSPQDAERFKALFSNIPFTGNRSLAVLSRMMTLGVIWGYRAGCAPEHPIKGVARYYEPPRERYFNEAELGRIMAAIESLDSKPGSLALLMLTETGARSGEVKRAHWDQFEFGKTRTIWTVESTNTKTARPIARVLSPAVVHRLLAWKPISDALRPADCEPKWVFPNLRDPSEPMHTLKGSWDVVIKRAKLKDTDRIHDLRHTVATMLLRRGVPLASVGDFLGHSTPLTTRRYAHVIIDRQSELTTMMSDVIDEARLARTDGGAGEPA